MRRTEARAVLLAALCATACRPLPPAPAAPSTSASSPLPSPPSAIAAGPSAAPTPTPLPSLDPRNPFGIENPTVAQLIEKLRDPDWRIRYHAAARLDRNDPPYEAIPALMAALRDPHEEVQTWAAHALGGMGPSGAVAIPALVELLKAERSGPRAAAARSLKRIGVRPEMAPALLEAVDRDDYKTGARKAAVEALADLAYHEPVVLRLVALLADKDGDVRGAAESGLVRMGSQALPAVPGLIAALEEPQGRGRRSAAVVLGHLGPGAGLAVPSLFGLLEDEDSTVRNAAAEAIRRIRRTRPRIPSP